MNDLPLDYAKNLQRFLDELEQKGLDLLHAGRGKEAERISVCRRKQSRRFCFANIILWLTHRPDFSGSKIQLHTLLLSCTSHSETWRCFFLGVTLIYLGIGFCLSFETVAAKGLPYHCSHLQLPRFVTVLGVLFWVVCFSQLFWGVFINMCF